MNNKETNCYNVNDEFESKRLDIINDEKELIKWLQYFSK